MIIHKLVHNELLKVFSTYHWDMHGHAIYYILVVFLFGNICLYVCMYVCVYIHYIYIYHDVKLLLVQKDIYMYAYKSCRAETRINQKEDENQPKREKQQP